MSLPWLSVYTEPVTSLGTLLFFAFLSLVLPHNKVESLMCVSLSFKADVSAPTN